MKLNQILNHDRLPTIPAAVMAIQKMRRTRATTLALTITFIVALIATTILAAIHVPQIAI